MAWCRWCGGHGEGPWQGMAHCPLCDGTGSLCDGLPVDRVDSPPCTRRAEWQHPHGGAWCDQHVPELLWSEVEPRPAVLP